MKEQIWKEIVTLISPQDEDTLITFKVHEQKDPDNFLCVYIKDKFTDDHISVILSKSLTYKIYQALGEELLGYNIGKGEL